MNIGFLIKHELSQFLRNWILFVSIFLCNLIGCFIIWYAPGNIIESGYASMNLLFSVYYWLLLIFIPTISMGKISDEKSSGLLELIISKPIKTRTLIIAKWIATFIVTLATILLTIPYCVSISKLGNLDWGITISGYVGLLLHSTLIISISLFSSARSKNSFNAIFYTWILLFIILAIPSTLLQLNLKSSWEIITLRFTLNEYFRIMSQGMMYVHGTVLYIVISLIFIILTNHTLSTNNTGIGGKIRHYLEIFILLTLISVSYFSPYRIDFSLSNKFSLSPITIETLKSNTTPIIVNVYYSDNIPEESMRYSRDLYMLLRAYRSESNAQFIIKTNKINSKEVATIATIQGILPLISNDNNTDSPEEIFFGATIEIGNNKTVINNITPNTPIEYEITRTIHQNIIDTKPIIGFSFGHNETPINQISKFIEEVGKVAHIRMVNINREDSLNSFDALCIIGPQNEFSINEIEKIEGYLNGGGRLFIALRHAIGRINDIKGTSWFTNNRTGLEEMLEYMGMKINYDFIIDNNCSTLAIEQNSLRNNQRNIKFPYFPIITQFKNHTITNGLNSIMLPFASSISQVKTPTTYVYRHLATTSSISGVQTSPIAYNVLTKWKLSDFQESHRHVAGILTNDATNGAVIAIANASFINDDIASMVGNDNINFAVNSVEWLSDNTGLIQLRNKYTTFPTLNKSREATTKWIKTYNTIIPLAIILLLFGLAYIKYHPKRLFTQ